MTETALNNKMIMRLANAVLNELNEKHDISTEFHYLLLDRIYGVIEGTLDIEEYVDGWSENNIICINPNFAEHKIQEVPSEELAETPTEEPDDVVMKSKIRHPNHGKYREDLDIIDVNSLQLTDGMTIEGIADLLCISPSSMMGFFGRSAIIDTFEIERKGIDTVVPAEAIRFALEWRNEVIKQKNDELQPVTFKKYYKKYWMKDTDTPTELPHTDEPTGTPAELPHTDTSEKSPKNEVETGKKVGGDRTSKYLPEGYITQTKLAEKVGYSSPWLSKFLSDHNIKPDKRLYHFKLFSNETVTNIVEMVEDYKTQITTTKKVPEYQKPEAESVAELDLSDLTENQKRLANAIKFSASSPSVRTLSAQLNKGSEGAYAIKDIHEDLEVLKNADLIKPTEKGGQLLMEWTGGHHESG